MTGKDPAGARQDLFSVSLTVGRSRLPQSLTREPSYAGEYGKLREEQEDLPHLYGEHGEVVSETPNKAGDAPIAA